MSEQNGPVWFITGCSTGLGRELAKLVLDCGWCVVATARRQESIQDLATQPSRSLALRLDVTSPSQITEAVRHAEATFGRIDVLVNNAGYGYMAGVEEGEDDEVRAMFETNFFGLVNMTCAVLPGMRKRRSGYIVNVSSMGGFVGQASSGYYNATKFAVEGLSEALAKEVDPFGMKVLIVEPGAFRTDWAGRSLRLTRHPIDDYDSTAGARRRTVTGRSGKQPGDPIRGAKAIIEAVQSQKAPLRLLLGRMALDTARGKLELLHQDFDTWEKLTVSADFPVGQ